MTPGILARMLLLGAVWGSSFLFMRITVPAVGAGATAAGRLALAAAAVSLLAWITGLVFERVPSFTRIKAALDRAGALFEPRGIEPLCTRSQSCGG